MERFRWAQVRRRTFVGAAGLVLLAIGGAVALLAAAFVAGALALALAALGVLALLAARYGRRR